MLKINLILAGGGVRFGAYIGALYALKEEGVVVDKIAGVSGGSIISTLYAAGNSLEQLKELMLEIDYEQFKDFSPFALFTGMGLYRGRRFEKWIDEMLDSRLFSGSFLLDHYVVATDVLAGKAIVFSKDTHPDFRVSQAVRYSIGIPLFYTFKKLPMNGKGHRIMVDGSLTAYSAEDIFCTDKNPTLTLRLAPSKSGFIDTPQKFSRIRYLQKLVRLLMNSIERERIAGDKWRSTIVIFSGDISSTKFNITREERQFLFEQGYMQVKDNLKKATLIQK